MRDLRSKTGSQAQESPHWRLLQGLPERCAQECGRVELLAGCRAAVCMPALPPDLRSAPAFRQNDGAAPAKNGQTHVPRAARLGKNLLWHWRGSAPTELRRRAQLCRGLPDCVYRHRHRRGLHDCPGDESLSSWNSALCEVARWSKYPEGGGSRRDVPYQLWCAM